MRILFFGDIVGRVGRDAVHLSLKELKLRYNADFVILNAENATHGRGLSKEHYQALLKDGADAMTLGNHWHDAHGFDSYIEKADRLIRPLNLLDYEHGLGSRLFLKNGVPIRVTNILGTSFMKEEVASPHVSMERLLQEIEPSIHIVDYHAETTSEKALFAHYFDGRVSAVLGTHTHVQTSDEKILAKGTAFLTDVGMNGDADGILGFEAQSAVNRILLGGKIPCQIDPNARKMVNAALLDIEEDTYRAKAITRINFVLEETL